MNIQIIKKEFTKEEISTLAEYLYLSENNEGSGEKNSAWELLWKEFQQKHTLWASAQNKLYKVKTKYNIHNLTSNDLFQIITKKG